MRAPLLTTRRWVIKIGSSLLTARGAGLDRVAIADWCRQIAALRDGGRDIVLVSSGAVAEGMARLGLRQRPSALRELQAAAAVGQMGLVQAWENGFAEYRLRAAQILLTHEDVADRERYLNARGTLRTLLEYAVVPVVNENDTVSTDEIRLGDNDTLGALTLNLVEADLLVILTDQQGLFDSDPRLNPDARLISEISLSEPALNLMAGDSKGELGRGGMRTKIGAARLAERSAASTVIAYGRSEDVLLKIAAGEAVGTWLQPGHGAIASRKRWIAGHRQVRGQLVIDAGAERVLREQGKSLLPVGVRQVSGDFVRGELVACVNERGEEIARGLVNYNADEAQRIAGAHSDEIAQRLGYAGAPELIHRDNLVLAEDWGGR